MLQVPKRRWRLKSAYCEKTMHEIALSVSEICNVSLELMRGTSTGLVETNARYVAMTIALVLQPEWEPRQVGAYFYRHRSVVRVAQTLVSRAVLTGSPPGIARFVRRVSVEVGVLPSALLPKA
jgi:hypothetical protein